MGIILILTAPKMTALDKTVQPGFDKGLFIGGFLFSVISPGFIVWWATIGVSTIVKALLFGMAGVIFLTFGHWLADTLWYWSISYALDKGKAHLTDRTYRNAIRFFSILIIFLGFSFLIIRK
ncbi:MAG: hypothetical protein A2Z72_00460 [Omnitrophica bacterium RBG_13_46_9]|nr:MAG: hypothetical protein A2Z72_00460 [Omnitrophica bacterium RBG_13_46_9]